MDIIVYMSIFFSTNQRVGLPMIGGHLARSHLSLGSPPGFIGGVRGGDSGGLSGALPGEQGGISTWAAPPSWPVHKVRAGGILQ